MTTDTLLRLALEASLRSTAVAGLVAVVLAVTRVRSNSVRHRVWLAVLVSMMLMPVLPYCVPSVSVPMPATHSVGALADFVPPIDRQIAPAEVVVAPAPPRAPAAPREDSESSSAGARASGGGAPRALGERWPETVAAIYLPGFVILAARLVIGWRHARRLLGNRQPGSVSVSALVATPVTVGVLSPRVVLPSASREWPAEKLQAVLAHERAHIARRDPLVAFLAAVNRCVFWFHPLAWWLERKLAATAEHACDEAAVRELGEPRRAEYAEVLLDMAEAARRAGGRLAWQGVGVVDGTSLIARRIDRILSGRVGREMSRLSKAGVAIASAGAIFIGAACQRVATRTFEPLKENPEVTARFAEDQARSDEWAAARAMKAADIKALEAHLAANPEDEAARRKAVLFYSTAGAEVIGWDEMVAAKRRHALWLIAHHPDSTILVNATPSYTHDLEGYAQARRLWLAYLDRRDVSSKALHNAARFFFGIDSPVAERIILRGRAMEPGDGQWVEGRTVYGSSWTNSLGQLYAAGIIGAIGPQSGMTPPTVSKDVAHGEFAQSARKTLEATSDPELLAAAGQGLIRPWARGIEKLDFDPKSLAISYLTRAQALAPNVARIKALLAAAHDDDLWTRNQVFRTNVEATSRARALEAMSDAERLEVLPMLADEAYMYGESDDYYRHDSEKAKAQWKLCRTYAEQTLVLAAKLPNHPKASLATHRAHLALGTLALRDGDITRAVRELDAAGNVTPTEAFAVNYISMEYRLVNTLLQNGERESVAKYLEQTADFQPDTRDRKLKDAAAIRAGYMTESLQRMLAHK